MSTKDGILVRCSVEGCDHPSGRNPDGKCAMHYAPRLVVHLCSVEGCKNPSGYSSPQCAMHREKRPAKVGRNIARRHAPAPEPAPRPKKKKPCRVGEVVLKSQLTAERLNLIKKLHSERHAGPAKPAL